MDEILVEVDHPEEGLNCSGGVGLGTIQDGAEILRIWAHPIGPNQVTQELHLCHPETTFFRVEAEIGCLESFHHGLEAVVVFRSVPPEDEDVVNVEHDSLQAGEGLVDEALEGGGALLETHREAGVLPQSLTGDGGGEGP